MNEFQKRYSEELNFVKTVEADNNLLIGGPELDDRRINIYFDLFVNGGFSYPNEQNKKDRLKAELASFIDCGCDYDAWKDGVTNKENTAKRGLWNKMTGE